MEVLYRFQAAQYSNVPERMAFTKNRRDVKTDRGSKKFHIWQDRHDKRLSSITVGDGNAKMDSIYNQPWFIQLDESPHGFENLAPYFQEIMTSEVLNGYVNHICELYMDDCIPYGKTEDEFVQNVSNIFARFKERNIIVSPDKCFLGLEEIEVLGHTLNKEGLSFSREKLQGVCDIPLPETGKKMQSFLGLTNYFREHVKNMTQMERPLRKLSLQYPNNTKIQWTEEGKLQFIELQQAIWNLPTLFL